MRNKTLLSTLFLSGVAVAGQSAGNDPNIIIILSDDQGWGATSVQMDDLVPASASDFMRTPNLERLAARGIRFANGYTCHPNSSPSRASLITGKTPARLGMIDIVDRAGGSTDAQFKLISPLNVRNIAAPEITIAEIIKQNKSNYGTAWFGKWHLSGGGPQSHGFDVSDGATGNAKGNLKLENNPKDIFGVTSRSVEWMETQVNEGKPFFLTVAHYAVHEETECLPATSQKYAGYTPGARHNNVSFASMTEDLDTGVGLLLDKVHELGIEDNTYIIYLADNGSMPGLNPGNTNGPIRGSKATVWDGGIKTPFIVAGPGIEANKVSHVRVVGWDLYPTICELLGITELPENLDGGSFLSVLNNGGEGSVQRPDDIMVWHWPCYVLNKEGYPTTAIIKDSLKFIHSYETGLDYLFNIEKDIAETTLLNNVYPAKLTEMKNLMNQYLTSVNAPMPTPNPNYIGTASETPEDLFFYFPFNGNLNDSTGQVTANENNAPAFSEGKYGQALTLNGSKQWVDVRSGDYVNPDVSKTQFTICAWVYNTNLHTESNSIVLTQTDGSGTGRIILDKMRQTGGSSLSTFLGGARVNATTLNFRDNEWVHVAAVGDYSNKSVTFYINGEQDGNTITTAGAFETCVGNFRIGGHKDGTKAFWTGKLDEMYFFQHALSQEEIVKVMNNEWEITSGIEQNTISSSILIYPNPTNHIINIKGIEDVSAVSLLSIDGRLVKRNVNTQAIDVRDLMTGQYILKIETRKGKPVYKKVIIDED